MGNNLAAFQQPIKEGLIRIFLRVKEIECEIENDAPDFVSLEKDQPILKIIPSIDLTGITAVFDKPHPLRFKSIEKEAATQRLELENGGIWFDISMEQVKEVWLSDFDFKVESEKPRYLSYFIKNVNHNLEWLQNDPKLGEIRSLSNVKKNYAGPNLNQKEMFSGADVLMCADMIGRAIKKIDVRIGSAMVKFNIDKRPIEPLLVNMAKKLGYDIDPLEAKSIESESRRGNSVSHIISLSCRQSESKTPTLHVKSY